MLLTENDLTLVRESIEKSAGWDPELLGKIKPLVHAGAFDDALRSAFVVLEERLRKSVNKEDAHMTAMPLVDYAFGGGKGHLAKHFGDSQSEREGLHSLFAGAFKLYRNPRAHRLHSIDTVEAKFILGFVNLLLLTLHKVTSLNPTVTFPPNLEGLLSEFENREGTAAATRVRLFLSRCVDLGLTPRTGTKKWIGFRRYARVRYPHWKEPRSHAVTLFYFYIDGDARGLWFPVHQYHSNVVGFDTKPIANALRALGFTPNGKAEDYSRRLTKDLSQEFYNSLSKIVEDTVAAFEATM
jgi:hypothetical protein